MSPSTHLPCRGNLLSGRLQPGSSMTPQHHSFNMKQVQPSAQRSTLCTALKQNQQKKKDVASQLHRAACEYRHTDTNVMRGSVWCGAFGAWSSILSAVLKQSCLSTHRKYHVSCNVCGWQASCVTVQSVWCLPPPPSVGGLCLYLVAGYINGKISALVVGFKMRY